MSLSDKIYIGMTKAEAHVLDTLCEAQLRTWGTPQQSDTDLETFARATVEAFSAKVKQLLNPDQVRYDG